MYDKGLLKRFLASTLSLGLVFVSVPPVGALSAVQGTVKAAGPAWVAGGGDDWSTLSSTRPLVSGDRLRTGQDGYLLADLGSQGVVGLYGNAEIAADKNTIGVEQGKVAFRMDGGSDLRIAAAGAAIAADTDAYGYVEVIDGKTTVTSEHGSLVLSTGGTEQRLGAGQRAVLGAAGDKPVIVAGAYGEPTETEELPAAPPPPPPAPAPVEAAPPPAPAPAKLTAPEILGWTALAGVVGVVIWQLVDDDDDGSPR